MVPGALAYVWDEGALHVYKVTKRGEKEVQFADAPGCYPSVWSFKRRQFVQVAAERAAPTELGACELERKRVEAHVKEARAEVVRQQKFLNAVEKRISELTDYA